MDTHTELLFSFRYEDPEPTWLKVDCMDVTPSCPLPPLFDINTTPNPTGPPQPRTLSAKECANMMSIADRYQRECQSGLIRCQHASMQKMIAMRNYTWARCHLLKQYESVRSMCSAVPAAALPQEVAIALSQIIVSDPRRHPSPQNIADTMREWLDFERGKAPARFGDEETDEGGSAQDSDGECGQMDLRYVMREMILPLREQSQKWHDMAAEMERDRETLEELIPILEAESKRYDERVSELCAKLLVYPLLKELHKQCIRFLVGIYANHPPNMQPPQSQAPTPQKTEELNQSLPTGMRAVHK